MHNSRTKLPHDFSQRALDHFAPGNHILYADQQDGIHDQRARAAAAEWGYRQALNDLKLSSGTPRIREIIEYLGFDPTNHHNAAKCPYCRMDSSTDQEPSRSE